MCLPVFLLCSIACKDIWTGTDPFGPSFSDPLRGRGRAPSAIGAADAASLAGPQHSFQVRGPSIHSWAQVESS